MRQSYQFAPFGGAARRQPEQRQNKTTPRYGHAAQQRRRRKSLSVQCKVLSNMAITGGGGHPMAKYAFFFTYSSETWQRMIQNPGDRTAAVRQLATSLGGSVESIYWMFGPYDGLLIADVPDSVGAAALSVAV